MQLKTSNWDNNLKTENKTTIQMQRRIEGKQAASKLQAGQKCYVLILTYLYYLMVQCPRFVANITIGLMVDSSAL